jgi:hypothetical protein
MSNKKTVVILTRAFPNLKLIPLPPHATTICKSPKRNVPGA